MLDENYDWQTIHTRRNLSIVWPRDSRCCAHLSDMQRTVACFFCSLRNGPRCGRQRKLLDACHCRLCTAAIGAENTFPIAGMGVEARRDGA